MKEPVIAITVLFLGLLYLLGFEIERHEFVSLGACFVGLFCIYFLVCFSKTRFTMKHGLLLALVARLVLLPAYPALSDDVHRFLWDGLLSLNGISPYAFTPESLVNALPSNMSYELYDALNSKTYYSVYPPLSQWIFALTAYLSAGHIIGFTIIMKGIFIITEVGIVYFLFQLLDKFNIDRHKVLLYALNPLVIMEGVGNLHFELIMGLFVLALLHFLVQRKWLIMTLLFSASIAIKMVSAILWPFLIPWLGFKRWLVYSCVLGFGVVFLFFPLWNLAFLQHFTESLDLYFRTFEFNASIYYVVRIIGTLIKGYNPIAFIGPFLSIVSFICILWLVYRNKKKSLHINLSLFTLAFIIYLLFSTTIHPWYLMLPILISPLLSFRFVLVWSSLIWLSYYAYSIEEVHESMVILLIEYAGLCIALWFDRKRIWAATA